MQTHEAAAPPLPHRIAFISIVAFWTLYFAILTFRALAIYHYHYGMAARTIVSLGGIGITILFYLILRRIPTTRMGLGITVAALLAAPCAAAYSTVNYYAFRQSAMEEESMSWHKKAAKPARPPATQPTMTVGAMKSHDQMSMLGEIADQAANGYFFFASWAALYLALCYAAQLGAAERRAAQLQAAAQSAELRALRYQVNPHFLFNTLNSLSSLVLIGKRDEAERMILNLATFFRTSLTGDPTEDVPLGEEIQLQRLYLDIETVRFPERLTVAIDLPEALRGACVPGLILQPLVENAVKYGVSRTRRPVTVRIRAREEQGQLQLIVDDDGDPMENDAIQGTGVGLRNVRDRLAARYGADGHSFWGRRPEGGFSVTLQMPLVRDGC
jgi:hypothetical protein